MYNQTLRRIDNLYELPVKKHPKFAYKIKPENLSYKMRGGELELVSESRPPPGIFFLIQEIGTIFKEPKELYKHHDIDVLIGQAKFLRKVTEPEHNRQALYHVYPRTLIAVYSQYHLGYVTYFYFDSEGVPVKFLASNSNILSFLKKELKKTEILELLFTVGNREGLSLSKRGKYYSEFIDCFFGSFSNRETFIKQVFFFIQDNFHSYEIKALLQSSGKISIKKISTVYNEICEHVWDSYLKDRKKYSYIESIDNPFFKKRLEELREKELREEEERKERERLEAIARREKAKKAAGGLHIVNLAEEGGALSEASFAGQGALSEQPLSREEFIAQLDDEYPYDLVLILRNNIKNILNNFWFQIFFLSLLGLFIASLTHQ